MVRAIRLYSRKLLLCNELQEKTACEHNPQSHLNIDYKTKYVSGFSRETIRKNAGGLRFHVKPSRYFGTAAALEHLHDQILKIARGDTGDPPSGAEAPGALPSPFLAGPGGKRRHSSEP